MGNSLQEQLLKAGLANQKKLHEVTQEKRKQAKQAKPAQAEDTGKQQIERALAEKQARDLALEQQKQAAVKAREHHAQIKQIIEQHRIMPVPGDIPYHFVDRNKIKTLYITKKIQHQLAQGQLAISACQGGYALIPAEIVEKIHQRDPDWFIVSLLADAPPPADDPYAQYTVPDDLMW